MKHHDSNPLHERNEGIEFFKYLVKIATADGVIDKSEEKILHQAGRKFGLTEPEIDKLITTPEESAYHPPYELEKRFNQLYSIIRLMITDDEIHQEEMKFTRYFALASGFEPDNTDKLINFIIKGIKDNQDAEDLFTKYKKGI